MSSKIRLVLLVVGVVYMTSCKHDPFPAPPINETPSNPDTNIVVEPDDTCDPAIVYFNQVQQIFNSNCATSGCHDMPRDGNDKIGLGSYTDILNTVINKGKFDDLLEMIKWEKWETKFVNEPDKWTKVMPPYPSAKMSDSLIDLIQTWYAQGYTDKICVSCDTSNVTWDSKIKSIIASNCHSSGCHGPTDPFGGKLVTKLEVMTSMEDSLTYFMERLRHEPNLPIGVSWMPKGAPIRLSDCKIASLEIWAANNYP